MIKTLRFINENKWIILILIVAIILRLYHLDFQSLWMDEIYTMNISNPNIDFSSILTEVKSKGGFPYLYFILLNFLFTLFGWSSFVARLFSAVFGILVVYIIYKLGEELYNKKVGYYAAILITFSEYAIYISQDARPYTFYLFGVILSFYYMVKFIKLPQLKTAIAYGLAAGFVINTNYFSFINLFAQFVIIFFYFLLSAKNDKISFIKNSLISASIALVLFLPNTWLFLNVFGFKSAWIPPPQKDSFTVLFNEFLGNSEMTLFFITPIFTFYVVNLFKEKETFNIIELIKNKNIFAFTVVFPWIFLFVLTIFMKSYLDTPLIISRYFISILPVLLIVLSIGVFQIKNNIIKNTVFFSLIFLIFTNSIIVKKYYHVPNKTQFREAAQLVIDNNKNNEPVFTSLNYFFSFYFQQKFNSIEKPNLETILNEMMTDSSKIKPFWYVDGHGRPFVLSENAQKFLNNNFDVENNFDGFDSWGKHFILLKDVPSIIDISKFKDLQQLNGDVFNSSIETFEYNNNLLKAFGWAYFNNQDATETIIDLVFIKDGIAKRLSTQKVNRPDVTTYFNSVFNLSNSGFSSSFDTSSLSNGKYTIGIYLKNLKTNKEGLILTDRIIEK